MKKAGLCKSIARCCIGMVALSYCIVIGIHVAAGISIVPRVLGPFAGITALVLTAIDDSCQRSWLVIAAAILGILAPFFVPAIASA